LLDNRQLREIAETLVPTEFSLDAHRKIYAAMLSLMEQGIPADMITLAEHLDKTKEFEGNGGVTYLSSLIDGVPERASLKHYVAQVKDAAKRRIFSRGAEHALRLSSDRTVSTAGLSEAALALSEVAAGCDPLPPRNSEEFLALRFARQYADELRYVAHWGRWMYWNGTCWRQDDTLSVFDRARAICRRASVQCGDGEKATAVRLAASTTVAAVEKLARADRQHAAVVDQWDTDPWLLNTPAGTANLRTGEIHPHQREQYHTKITAASLGGECPRWLKFLDRITAGNHELQSFLQRVIGYSLTGITIEHSLFFCYGTGANGKSVFVRTNTELLGDYAKTAPTSTFTATNTEQHPTDLAGLRGVRFVSATETEEDTRWAEAKIKSLTGGDRIAARFMRQDFFEYVPQFKLFVAGNRKPGLRSVDEAIRRRLHLIPFTVTIPEGERDLRLADKLKAEWPGILRWAIEGCLAWQREGLNPPAVVRNATSDYFAAEDAIGRWLEDRCITGAGYWTPVASLFANWQRWSAQTGEQEGSQKRFTQQLEARGFQRHRTARGRGFMGIALREIP
jgi:putative DNA primase/helicase